MHVKSDRVAVVIVNFNSSSLLAGGFVTSGVDVDSDVVVVDNFFDSAERASIRDLCAEHSWTFIPAEGNLGFGRACDIGIAAARNAGHRIVLLLNPDAEVTPGVVAHLAEVVRANPGAMVSPAIDRPDGSVWMENTELLPWRGMARHAPVFRDDFEITWLTAATLMLSIDAWGRLGGFDHDYFLYWEDVDLTYRHHLAGGELRIERTVRAIHAVGGTQAGPASKSSTYMYYAARNRLLFARKNFGTGRSLGWLVTSPYFLYELMKAARTRSPRVWLSLLGSALRGTVRGLASHRAAPGRLRALTD